MPALAFLMWRLTIVRFVGSCAIYLFLVAASEVEEHLCCVKSAKIVTTAIPQRGLAYAAFAVQPEDCYVLPIASIGGFSIVGLDSRSSSCHLARFEGGLAREMSRKTIRTL